MAYNILNSSLNPIDQDQCIGDTLDTFNVNFSALDTSISRLSAAVGNVPAAYNDTNLYTLINTVSSNINNLTLRTAKAWVNFSTNASQVITINSSLNITGITAPSSGRYTVTVPFNITNTPINITTGYNIAGNYPTYGSITSRTSNSVTFRSDTGVGGGGNYNDISEISVVFY
jgi:hypothetical protein